MPVIVPRKVVPIKEAKPPVEPAAPTAISPDEVKALMEAQAADFAKQIEAVTRAFTGALAAATAQPQGKKPAGWNFKVEYLNNGDIDTIKATPQKPTQPPTKE